MPSATIVPLYPMETKSMLITNEALVVLWLGAGAVLLWMWLPAVFNALGLTLWQVTIDDDATALEPSGNDAEYDELFDELRGLGFVPVGRRSKKCWFFTHHWFRNFQSLVFAGRRGDCLAVLYKLRSWDRWRLCFVTAFSDGAIVHTANQMEKFRRDEPDYLRWALATPDRALLLGRHREVCQSFAAAGSRSVAVLPVEEINRLELHHEARNHRKHHRWTGLQVMSNSLWRLGIGLLIMARYADTAPYLMPVSVIVTGLMWPALHDCLFRASASRFRADDARRQCSQQTPRLNPH